MNKKLTLIFLTIFLVAGIQVQGGADFPIPKVEISVMSDGKHIEPRAIEYNQFETFLTEETFTFGNENEPNVWVQKLNNGDIFIYYRQERDAPGRIVTIDFFTPGITEGGKYWSHEYKKRSNDINDDLDVVYSPKDTQMAMSLNEGIAYVEFGEWQRSIFISNPGRFKDHPVALQKKVAGSSPAHIVILPEKISLVFEFSQTDAEFEEGFIVFSDKKLIPIENERSFKALIATDLNLIKKLTRDGWWYTTRVGDYKGSEEDCYYFNPGFYPSNNLISWYCQPTNRLFSDVVLSSLRAAVQGLPECGYHKSQVIPLMFYRWYGMTNDYIDTRFSVDGVRFLVKCAKLLESPGARKLSTLLAEKLMTIPDEQKTYIGDGYFLNDYITPEPLGVKMHTSLNHALCEINYFLELSELTGEKRYADVANKILLAVDETWSDWIKPNGDLWYAYFPETETYGRNDYEMLTYMDLKETQKLHQQTFGYSRLSIQYLLDAKEEYLRGSGKLNQE